MVAVLVIIPGPEKIGRGFEGLGQAGLHSETPHVPAWHTTFLSSVDPGELEWGWIDLIMMLTIKNDISSACHSPSGPVMEHRLWTQTSPPPPLAFV